MNAILILVLLGSAAPVEYTPLGETVRILREDAGEPLEGVLETRHDGVLGLDTGEGTWREIAEADLLRMEVLRHEPSKAGQGFGLGAMVGLLGGVVTGQIVGQDGPKGFMDLTPTKAQASLGLGIVGFLVGGGVGALIGSTLGGDRWVEVTLPHRADPDEAVEVGVRILDQGPAFRVRRRF